MVKVRYPQVEIEQLKARLEEAEETLRAIREGEVDAVVVSGPQGERVYTLKGSEHLPRIILQEMAEGVVTISEGHIVYANRCFTKLTKIPSEEIVGRAIKDFILPEEYVNFQHILAASRAESASGEFTMIDAKGHIFPACISFNTLESESISGHCLIIRDLTDLKKAETEALKAKENLEVRVKERTKELARANAQLAVMNENLARSNNELEQFAYISSHDLQEPLRTISSYVDLFKMKYHDKIDKNGQKFLDFMQEGSHRALGLIHGLLSYARIGMNEKPFQTVAIGQLVNNALANLKTLIDENAAVVTVDKLPTLFVNEIEITQLFQNLIANAIKYRREETPRIHISAKKGKGGWIFSVQDNGQGIEKEYVEYIFMLFKRLHGRASSSGTGLGLSVCKKIVKTHGGDIWVDSTPKLGSIFYFTIPVA
jgi:PAS domain S-box-containing protein